MPKFKHDCEGCEFLATIQVMEIDIPPKADCTYDLYYCPSPSRVPTLIARYGDGGAQYLSGVEFADVNPVMAFALVAAKRLEKDMGLYTDKT